jgi:hypothetical protein
MQFPHSRSLNIKTSSTSLTWREKDLQQRPQQGNLEDRVEITACVLAASSGESISSFEVVEMSSDPPTAILLGIDMYSLESALMVLLHRGSLIAFILALSLPRLHTYHHGGLLPPPHLNSPHLIRLSHPFISRRKMSGLGYEVRAGWSNPGMRNHPHVFRLVWNYLPTHYPWSADQSIPNQLSSENNTSSIELDITPVGVVLTLFIWLSQRLEVASISRTLLRSFTAAAPPPLSHFLSFDSSELRGDRKLFSLRQKGRKASVELNTMLFHPN